MEGAYLPDPLVETWEIHARINLYLPDAVLGRWETGRLRSSGLCRTP
ncbi:MAG: hypothetical protein ABW277_25135 [Longimicrobiaceae bacterium]